MTSDREDLFPTYSHEQRLEDESLDELRRILRGLFVVRDQRQRDFGVDLSIEILINERATNYVSMVQVKARSNLQPNRDGSLSLSIQSSNIEYLLSAASSTIVLYDADRKAFYWADLLDEVLMLRSQGVNYRDQASVAIRFNKRLERDTVTALHAALLDRGRAERQLRMQIASLEAGELVHVNDSRVGTTSNDVEREFFSIGWRLGAQGHVEEVARMFCFLAPAAQQNPRVRLLMSHAHACNGQAIAAWSHANEARRRENELSSDDRDFLDLIEIGIDHVLGRESDAKLAERENTVRGRAKPELRMQLEVSALRQEVTRSTDPSQTEWFVERARSLIDSMSIALGESHPATLSARVLESQLSGSALAYRYALFLMTSRYGDSTVGLQIRSGKSVRETILNVSELMASWLRENAVAQRACAGWPLLVLELEQAELVTQVAMMRYTRLARILHGKDAVLDLAASPASELLASIRHLRDHASALRVDDVEVRARLTMIELLELGDRGDQVREEAQALAAFCKACGYRGVEEEARAHCQGLSKFQLHRHDMKGRRGYPFAQNLAAASVAERRQIAENICSFLHLPSDRLSNILDDVECTATEQGLQASWCRHLQVHQLMEHADNGTSIYVHPLRRRCWCGTRDISTMFPSPDWQVLIREFQRSYCEGCSARDPSAE